MAGRHQRRDAGGGKIPLWRAHKSLAPPPRVPATSLSIAQQAMTPPVDVSIGDIWVLTTQSSPGDPSPEHHCMSFGETFKTQTHLKLHVRPLWTYLL